MTGGKELYWNKKTALGRFYCEGKKGNVVWKKKLLLAWFISLHALLHLLAYLTPRTTWKVGRASTDMPGKRRSKRGEKALPRSSIVNSWED